MYLLLNWFLSSVCTSYIHAHTQGDNVNCEGWLSPGGHGLGGRVLTAKVRGPQFNSGWLPVFHKFSNICLKDFHK